MSYLCCVTTLHHEKKLQILHVVNQELSKTIWHHMSSFCIASISNARHQILSLKSPTHSIINTLRFSPIFFDLIIPLRLMSNELLPPFFMITRLVVGTTIVRHFFDRSFCRPH